VAESIQRSLRLLIAATVVLYVAVGLVAAMSWSTAQTSQDALCALRSDLEARVATSLEFLAEHPEGVAGIPAKTIKDGINNQRRTISALRSLDC